MIRQEELKRLTPSELLARWPFAADFLSDSHLIFDEADTRSIAELLAQYDAEELSDLGIASEQFFADFASYLSQMEEFLGLSNQQQVQSLTILAGHDKSGAKEAFDALTLYPSQIVSIVGPTGSGKSRLLADIEWAAQGDTPTGRRILINNETPDLKWRFSPQNKLVAQLSQNMNFVMDLSVQDFLRMHAESRRASDPDALIEKILDAANQLAGERFQPQTAVTALSGGQSRALMIADTAILSSSPIVLIDEIENAGIDRERALSLLLSEEKIVLMATHDPMLALMADRRIVIKNGGIARVYKTSDAEKALLAELMETDRRIQNARNRLRAGEAW